ncbi:MAG TPA: DUF4838 domain-containing protein [Armatimonadota bacterium]
MMKRILLLALVCSGGLCWSAHGQAATITLARGGKALVTIAVHSTGAIPAEKTAATELAAYLQKITGAPFTTVEETALPAGTPAIYLGDTAFARAQGIDPGTLGAEESLLRTVGKNLILTGGRPRGTLYAVYELLETTLGCRWYTPWTEVVPNLPVCKIPTLDRRVQPYMRFRSHYTHLSPDGWKMYNAHNRFNEVTTGGLDESVGGGVAYGPRIFGGHGFAPYLPVDKYFKDHPEYYSLRDGKRVPSNGLDGNHACLTNPDVLRIITEGVLDDIRKKPTAYCFTVAVNDGGSSTICDCPECRKVAKQYGATDQRYTDSGLLLWFVNQVADAVKKEYPDKFIRTLAYGPASNPPKDIRARDNVIVQVCAGPRSEAVWLPKGADAKELQTLREWTRYAVHIWIWDYALACYNQPAYFRPLTWKMDEQFKLFKRQGGIDGMFQENELLAAEDSMFPQFYEMNEWIYGQLCRDPDREVNGPHCGFHHRLLWQGRRACSAEIYRPGACPAAAIPLPRVRLFVCRAGPGLIRQSRSRNGNGCCLPRSNTRPAHAARSGDPGLAEHDHPRLPLPRRRAGAISLPHSRGEGAPAEDAGDDEGSLYPVYHLALLDQRPVQP